VSTRFVFRCDRCGAEESLDVTAHQARTEILEPRITAEAATQVALDMAEAHRAFVRVELPEADGEALGAVRLPQPDGPPRYVMDLCAECMAHVMVSCERARIGALRRGDENRG